MDYRVVTMGSVAAGSRSLGGCLWGLYLVPGSLLYLSASCCLELSNFPQSIPFSHDIPPYLRPRAKESDDNGLNIWNHEPKTNFSSSESFLSGILLTVTKSWLARVFLALPWGWLELLGTLLNIQITRTHLWKLTCWVWDGGPGLFF